MYQTNRCPSCGQLLYGPDTTYGCSYCTNRFKREEAHRLKMEELQKNQRRTSTPKYYTNSGDGGSSSGNNDGSVIVSSFFVGIILLVMTYSCAGGFTRLITNTKSEKVISENDISISLETFEKISLGNTFNYMKDLLGSKYEFKRNDGNQDTYIWNYKDGSVVFCTFENYVLVKKQQWGLKNGK